MMKPSPGVVVLTYLHGPDRAMRYGFMLEWWAVGGVHHDASGRPTDATEGPKGQCFFADPLPYIERARARGERVVEVRQ
jgi:hypothetical protein